MIQRDLFPKLQQISQQYPVVTLLGPRQSGKTTLARTTFPAFDYINLETAVERYRNRCMQCVSKRLHNIFFSPYGRVWHRKK